MGKTRHRTATARSRMTAVPAAGVVVGRGPAGRHVSALVAAALALVAVVGAVVAVVGVTEVPSRHTPGWALIDAAVTLVAAAAAWSVSSARRRVGAGMALLVAGW